MFALFALVAFASNSLLCRLALGGDLIDPMSFTTIRLLSGALALLLISHFSEKPAARRETRGSWISGLVLFVYAAAFSFAYVSLSAGMGALVLFGTVQITMIGIAMWRGERLGALQWAGSVAAIGGLVYLLLPGISAPDPLGALLMCVSGVAWGIYSIRGRGVKNPVAMTSGNFLRAAPLAILISTIMLSRIQLETAGFLFAVASGVVTSGIGYVIWYKALGRLTTSQASSLQLLVPVIAAFGGVLLLSEELTARLVVASACILGGVLLAVPKRNRST